MQVPLTAVLLLFELTHDYSIILPTLGAVGLAYWIASLPTTATALQQMLPQSARSDLKAPGATPWQTSVDIVTDQLRMGVAGDNTGEESQRGEAPKALVISKVYLRTDK